MSKTVRMPSPENQAVLESLQVRIAESCELERCHQLLDEHHYLKSPKPVGERLYYVVTDAQGQWLAVMIFAAPAKHLRYRDQWIGWTDAQREKRLSLIVNNIRFLLIPDKTFPNLGTKSLRLILSRSSDDWQTQYGHPVVVETFVDPEQFCGTVYTANGWQELGKTDGSGRHQRDYYVRHDKPKRLFVRELCRKARRSLQAEHLKAAGSWSKPRPGCAHVIPSKRLRSSSKKLFPDLDLKGRLVSLDALHTQTQTVRDIVLEGGGDYLLTVKDNQQKLHQNIETLLPVPRADFPPLETAAHGVSHL